MARAATDDPVDVLHWGLRLRLRTRGNISEATFLFMPRRWDHEERQFLARHLNRSAVVVDVGANAGGYLWWLLHRLGPDCRILAVEPDPALHARLVFNLRTNGICNVEVLSHAVGPTAGEGWLHLDARNRGQNVLVDDGGDAESGRVRVEVQPLPEILELAGLRRVDALKLDVEGLEAAILQDFFDRAREPLWPGILLIERQPGPEHRRLMERLIRLGYAEALSTRLNVVLRRETT